VTDWAKLPEHKPRRGFLVAESVTLFLVAVWMMWTDSDALRHLTLAAILSLFGMVHVSSQLARYIEQTEGRKMVIAILFGLFAGSAIGWGIIEEHPFFGMAPAKFRPLPGVVAASV
jgi:RsiW-degrading membrane proteinase PrsW (M82 family)